MFSVQGYGAALASTSTHHLLQVLLLADVHHHQPLLDQAQAHVVLGVPELYGDVGAGGARVLHVQEALAVLDVPHHTVHHVRTGVLLETRGRQRKVRTALASTDQQVHAALPLPQRGPREEGEELD